MPDTPLGFGLIGFGAWGRFHADAIVKTNGATLRAISARSDESQQAARDAFSRSQHADYRELLVRRDIGVVDIAVPSHLHYEIASAALAAGKHLLLEKPITRTRLVGSSSSDRRISVETFERILVFH